MKTKLQEKKKRVIIISLLFEPNLLAIDAINLHLLVDSSAPVSEASFSPSHATY